MADATYLAGAAVRLVGSLALAAVGIWLVLRARGDRPTLTFGAFLLFEAPRSALSFLSGFAVLEGEGQLGIRLMQLTVVFALLIEGAILAFLVSLLEKRVRHGTAWLVAILATTIALVGLYLYDPRLYARFAVGESSVVRVANGPISYFSAFPTVMATGIFLLYGWLREADPARRRSLFLVALGFIVYRLQQATLAFTEIVGLREPTGSAPFAQAMNVVYLALLATGGLLLAIAHARPGGALRSEARAGALVIAGIVAAMTLTRLTTSPLDNYVVFAIPSVAFAALVVYGILRGRFFGLDDRARFTVRASTVGAIFLAVFLVVAELAGSFFQSAYGWAFGGLAAGVAIVAIHPIQRIAERVANAAVPAERAAARALAHDDRLRTYREQARVAWADGHLTSDERRMLDAAREALGLTHDEAAALEREAMGG